MPSRRPSQRHQLFYLAACLAIISCTITLIFWPAMVIAITANVFFSTYLISALARLPSLTPQVLRDHAASNDEPVWIIFLIVFASVVCAVFALFMLINQQHTPHWVDLAITIAAVPLGWATIHMMVALHYAHIYWQPLTTEVAQSETPLASGKEPRGGLKFPGTPQPCGSDFVYFSYVIGMTAQTSDTNITTSAMRRVNAVHAIVSFFFNTVLVAAAVNIVVALGN